MKRLVVQFLAFLLAGVAGIGLAVFATSQWIGASQAQQSAEVPPSVPQPPNMPPPAADPPGQGADGQVPPVEAPAEVVDAPAVAPPPPPPSQVEAGGNAFDPSNDPNFIANTEEGDVGATLRTILAPFIYQADNRRDPFQPFVTSGANAGGVSGPLLPLQRFTLDELKLIGVIWDVARPKAMFADPDKKIHILEKDDRIGRNNGYIAVIREGEVVIVETVDIRGELAYSTRVLPISK